MKLIEKIGVALILVPVVISIGMIMLAAIVKLGWVGAMLSSMILSVLAGMVCLDWG